MQARFVIAIALLFAMSAISSAKPAKDKEQLKPQPVSLSMESNWGTITQNGTSIAITGNAQWEARGEIRNDGSVLIMWTEKSNGRIAPGVYRVENGQLIGHWGYAQNVTIEADGSLRGSVNGERIYRVEPPMQ